MRWVQHCRPSNIMLALSINDQLQSIGKRVAAPWATPSSHNLRSHQKIGLGCLVLLSDRCRFLRTPPWTRNWLVRRDNVRICPKKVANCKFKGILAPSDPFRAVWPPLDPPAYQIPRFSSPKKQVFSTLASSGLFSWGEKGVSPRQKTKRGRKGHKWGALGLKNLFLGLKGSGRGPADQLPPSTQPSCLWLSELSSSFFSRSVPKRGSLNSAGKQLQESGRKSLQFFACCSGAFGQNDIRAAEIPMLQCNICSTAFRKLQPFSLVACCRSEV